MTKAASVFLRAEITPQDLSCLIQWLENSRVTRYLNEETQIVHSLRNLQASVPAPMLRFHFNRTGLFYLICRGGKPIGFVKLEEQRKHGGYEIVYAIGDEKLWGHGYGEDALRAALSKAFLERRAQQVIAKIHPENCRSIRTARACGFRRCNADASVHLYAITMREYLQRMSAD